MVPRGEHSKPGDEDRPRTTNDDPCKHSSFVTTITPSDVLFGRGTSIDKNEGNKRFREIVRQRKQEYNATNRNKEKNKIAQEIITSIESTGGSFLRQVKIPIEARKLGVPSGVMAWTDAERSAVHEKVKQALRSNLGEEANSNRDSFHAIPDLLCNSADIEATVATSSAGPSLLSSSSVGMENTTRRDTVLVHPSSIYADRSLALLSTLASSSSDHCAQTPLSSTNAETKTLSFSNADSLHVSPIHTTSAPEALSCLASSTCAMDLLAMLHKGRSKDNFKLSHTQQQDGSEQFNHSGSLLAERFCLDTYSGRSGVGLTPVQQEKNRQMAIIGTRNLFQPQQISVPLDQIYPELIKNSLLLQQQLEYQVKPISTRDLLREQHVHLPQLQPKLEDPYFLFQRRQHLSVPNTSSQMSIPIFDEPNDFIPANRIKNGICESMMSQKLNQEEAMRYQSVVNSFLKQSSNDIDERQAKKARIHQLE